MLRQMQLGKEQEQKWYAIEWQLKDRAIFKDNQEGKRSELTALSRQVFASLNSSPSPLEAVWMNKSW